MLLLPLGLLLLAPLAQDTRPEVTPSAVRLLDLDGDGSLDKLYLGTDGSLRVALHVGGRTYAEVPQELPKVTVTDVMLEDLDGDGALDLYLIAYGENVVLCGDGAGRFTVATDELGLANGGDSLSAERIDLDEDGCLDLLLHNRSHDVVYWALGNGTFELDAETLPVSVTPDQPVVLVDNISPAATAGGRLPAKTAGAPEPADELPAKEGTRRQVLDGGAVASSSSPPSQPRIPANLVSGTGATGRIPKWISGNKIGNSALTESGGNLGIGTTSPSDKLDVAGAVAVNGSQVIDATGQWVGDPTGLEGPQGPQGPPGVVSDAPLNNTWGGVNALLNNTTGEFNSAFGSNPLKSNTTGSRNTASGAGALLVNTTGNGNTASGTDALLSNTTGNGNTASGVNALHSNMTGFGNTAIGLAALLQNTSGSYNIALGYEAGLSNDTGDYNIAIGNAGNSSDNGTIRIGDSDHTRSFIAGIRDVTTSVGDSDLVVISSDDQLGTTQALTINEATNRVGIGTTGSPLFKLHVNAGGHGIVQKDEFNGVEVGTFTSASGGWLGTRTDDPLNFFTNNGGRDMVLNTNGRVGIGTSTPDTTLHVSGTARIGGGSGIASAATFEVYGTARRSDDTPFWTVISDKRLKKNIRDMDRALETLLSLRGVLFEYKDPSSVGVRRGFIAQEVEEVLPEWVEEGLNGYKQLNMGGFQALVVEALREVRAEKVQLIDGLRKENDELSRRVDVLEAAVAGMTAMKAELGRLAQDR